MSLSQGNLEMINLQTKLQICRVVPVKDIFFIPASECMHPWKVICSGHSSQKHFLK